MKKADLIKILVEEYGYEKEDIKLLTNAKLQAMIKQEEKDAEDLAHAETVIVKEAKFKDDDEIVVMNGQNGSLKHRAGRTGRVWEFKKFGQTAKMPYSELVALRNVKPSVFTDGWIIVLNKEVQKEFQLTELYENIITPENIEDIFKLRLEDLERFVAGLPKGMKFTFVSKARELYEREELYDLRVIKFIESTFGFSLEDNAPLADKIVFKK